MRTISTLCASSTAVSVSAVGLAFARVEGPHDENDEVHDSAGRARKASPRSALSAPPHRRTLSLTAVPFARRISSAREHDRSATGKREEHGRDETPQLRPRRSLQSAARASPSAGLGVDHHLQPAWEEIAKPGLHAATLSSPPQTWLRRLSSSMSGSRDSSRGPSRPGSAMLSHSNGSFSFSQTGSTAPIVSSQTPPPPPPNKLVKRTPSVRGVTGSPNSGSKLPLPVLRRPATSHQRQTMLRDSIPSYISSTCVSIDAHSDDTRDPGPRHYFVPRVATDDGSGSRRPRTSSGIPTPIRRVYPDRKYSPMLIPSSGLVRRASIAFDETSSDAEDEAEPSVRQNMPSAPASPALPMQSDAGTKVQTPRRSFSISDLLSSGPQPLWRRPSSSKGRNTLSRRTRPRNATMPSSAVAPAGVATTHAEEPPAKRRDITGLQSTPRSIHSSSSSGRAGDRPSSGHIDAHPSAGTPSSRSPAFATPSRVPSAAFSTSAFSFEPPSSEHQSTTVRPARLSAAQSELASTVGSESEIRSLGDASTDYQSDHVFDSLPTRATGSSVGRRGPHIETIFDDSPPTFSSGRSNKLRDFLSDGQTPATDHNARYRHSTIEEEGSVLSTPVRSAHNRSVASTPSARPGAAHVFNSSPPMLNHAADSDDDLDWDAEDDGNNEDEEVQVLEAKALSFSTPVQATPVNKSAPFRFGPALRFAAIDSTTTTPLPNGVPTAERTSVFDWSEPQPSPGQLDSSPPRPRTVHGKKDPEMRGSRAVGRRAPSAMHARSHSVPVVPDADGKRTETANKFGTWGVGSKGVSEDWDEDFDFGLPKSTGSPAGASETSGKRVDSGRDFDVPQRVKASQENVVANIGLLREWGLLIEELKELRIRAVGLGMLQGPHAQAWREVDAMIELADQESEEKTLEPRRSPPSSPGFDYDAFDDAETSRGTLPHKATLQLPAAGLSPPETPQSTVRVHSRQHTPKTRPRKDSELVAQSVIAALQAKRDVPDAVPLRPEPRKKVPFDTATLRHIVPYVNNLKRKVKDALRETEGLYSSPSRQAAPAERRDSSDDEPSFRSIFHDASTHQDGGAMRRPPPSFDHDALDWDEPDSPSLETSLGLVHRMQQMNLPA